MSKRHGSPLILILMLCLGAIPAEAAPFKAGSRSLGDPLLPQLGNGGYDARHYDIDLDYDPVANRFDSAVTTMKATAEHGLSEFSLDFQDLAVREVRVNGRSAAFQQVEATPDLSDDPSHSQPMKLVVTPRDGIRTGREFTVTVDYSGSEPQVFTDPDSSVEGWVPGCFTPTGGTRTCNSYYVVGEPIGSQAWFPSNNYPTEKASFDTDITVPTGKVAFGVGELKGDAPRVNGDGTSTWRWSEDDPTATYLVTASNGDFDYEETTAGGLPFYSAIDSTGTPEQKAAVKTTLARTGEMMDFLAEKLRALPVRLKRRARGPHHRHRLRARGAGQVPLPGQQRRARGSPTARSSTRSPTSGSATAPRCRPGTTFGSTRAGRSGRSGSSPSSPARTRPARPSSSRPTTTRPPPRTGRSRPPCWTATRRTSSTSSRPTCAGR